MPRQIVTGVTETQEDRLMSGEGIRPLRLDEYVGQEKTKEAPQNTGLFLLDLAYFSGAGCSISGSFLLR